MKSFIATFWLLACYATALGQGTFEQGYIIDEAGKRFDCYIKSKVLANNLLNFTYKLSLDDRAEHQLDIGKISAFGIGDDLKYIRAAVLRNKPIEANNSLSSLTKRGYITDTVLLSVLLEGEASLYAYRDTGLVTFFYSSSPSAAIEELVVRKYAYRGDLKTDNRFRQQLINSLNCEGLNQPNQTAYSKAHLLSFFEQYNNCINAAYKTYKIRTKIQHFRLYARTEAMFGTLRLVEPLDKTLNFGGKQPRFQYGVSFEYIMPIRSARWSLVLEPSIQHISAETKPTTTLEHSSIEIPIGVRHYLPLRDEFNTTEIYVSGLYLWDIASKTEVAIEGQRGYKSVITDGNLSLGMGIMKQRYSAGIRIKLRKDLLAPYWELKLGYGGLSFDLSLRLF